MLLYSLDQGVAAGRIGLTSEASVSDLLITPENYTQQLNDRLGFGVYLVLGSLKKTFTVWSKPMYYGYPGDYYIKIWLQNNGPFDYSTTAPVKVTDSKYLNFSLKIKEAISFFKIQNSKVTESWQITCSPCLDLICTIEYNSNVTCTFSYTSSLFYQINLFIAPSNISIDLTSYGMILD